MPRRFRDFLAEDAGGVLVEHALLLGFVAVAVFAALGSMGETLAEFFGDIGDLFGKLAGGNTPSEED